MPQNYESITYVSHEEAAEALQLLERDGEAAVFEFLKQSYSPGEGTLVSTRDNPWKEQDSVYERDDWVMYYNIEVPYFGLVARLGDLSR